MLSSCIPIAMPLFFRLAMMPQQEVSDQIASGWFGFDAPERHGSMQSSGSKPPTTMHDLRCEKFLFEVHNWKDQHGVCHL